jgi:FkbM family methyltransferase
MKEQIAAIIPKAWMPSARRVHRWLVGRRLGIRHAYRGVDRLSALRCVVSYNQYGGYCVPQSSFYRPAARAVLSGKVYEPKTIEFMMANCRDRDIVHAGTFFGDFFPALSTALDSRAVIWAFEPNRENFRCANITLELNEVTNVRLTHAGLGARRATLFVQTEDASGLPLGGSSRIVSTGVGREKNEPVEILPVDEAVPAERDVGIVQLDVEGYEKEALSGALATIRRCLPILILEVLPESTLVRGDWFAKNILSLGYELTAKLHGNSVYACPGR